MNLHLRVYHARFGFDLAADLEDRKHGPVSVTVEPVSRFALHYRSTLSLRQVSALLEALSPLSPEEVMASSEIEADRDAVLWIGESGSVGETSGFRERPVSLYSDSAPFAERTLARLAGLGVSPRLAGIQAVNEDVLLWSNMPKVVQQIFRWYLARLGINVPAREDGNYYDCFALFLRDPEQLTKPATQRFPVEVACDDPTLGQELLDALGQRGFAIRKLVALPEFEAVTMPFTVHPGAFTSDRFPTEFTRLQGALSDCFQRLGIDPARYPIQIDTSTTSTTARITAPLATCKAGKKAPYAGAYPERFSVTIVTDEVEGVEGLKTRLREAGFRKLDVILHKSLVEGPDDGSAGEFWPGYAAAWNEAAQYPGITGMLMGACRGEMEAIGAKDFVLRRYDYCGGDVTTVRLYFPIRGVKDGTLFEKVADPSRYFLKIHTPKPDGWKALIAELRTWKFASVDIVNEVGDPTICYGAATLELIDRMKALVKKHHGSDPNVSKSWGDNEYQLSLYMPDRAPSLADASAAADIPEEMATQLEVWAYGDSEPETMEGFIEVAADRLRLGNVWLTRLAGQRHPLAPHPSSFSHFCIDRLTAATLEHVATSVLLHEPCLLEGETSTSKTSSILFLASLLNQPVARINLNGQTDTGELIGRFVPQHLILELPMSSQELYAAADLLEAETRMILEKARRENRPLTRVEIQQIMAQEEMTSHPWRWEDGLVPQAMRRGWWVLLDEVNLGEPQILERINSVLETDPGLVLTEYDNSVIGSTGTPVHADFRIFATMNPAEYAGRSVLSPAYRDRWRGYRFVPRPGEEEFHDMLRLLVHGEQPDFCLHGRNYLGPQNEPRYRVLQSLPYIDSFLEALARFHVALEHAVGQTADSVARIGGRRRERYVFTRRGLLSMLDYLVSPLYQRDGQLDTRALRRAILRYYVGRLSTAEDRAMVIQLLDAHGLGPNTWQLS
jgi:MoxR-like ATPase